MTEQSSDKPPKIVVRRGLRCTFLFLWYPPLVALTIRFPYHAYACTNAKGSFISVSHYVDPAANSSVSNEKNVWCRAHPLPPMRHLQFPKLRVIPRSTADRNDRHSRAHRPLQEGLQIVVEEDPLSNSVDGADNLRVRSRFVIFFFSGFRVAFCDPSANSHFFPCWFRLWVIQRVASPIRPNFFTCFCI